MSIVKAISVVPPTKTPWVSPRILQALQLTSVPADETASPDAGDESDRVHMV